MVGAGRIRPGLLGILLGLAAYALFGVHDATIKWLVATVPVPEVVFVRSAIIFVACLLIGRRRLVECAVATPMKRLLILRGLLTLAAWLCYFTAARSLPLAKLLSLYFAAPLLVTVMAAPLLGERVGAGRWGSVLVGFAGVMVVTDPWGVEVSLPTFLVLGAAAMWAYGVILMRRIARRESSFLQIAYISFVFLIGSGIASAFTWHGLTRAEWGLLALVALLGGLGQWALFEAARHAQAAVLASVEYSSLLWAFLLGWLIWGDVPPAAVFGGAALILLSGALLVATERRAARTPAPA